MRCSLGIRSFESSQGDPNVHQNWEPLLCRVGAEAKGISYATHATKWMEQADQLEKFWTEVF